MVEETTDILVTNIAHVYFMILPISFTFGPVTKEGVGGSAKSMKKRRRPFIKKPFSLPDGGEDRFYLSLDYSSLPSENPCST